MTNFIEDDKIADQFKAIYNSMKPNLPRCAPIRVSALKNAKVREAKEALKWLIVIQQGKYTELMNVIKCMPPDRWKLLMITAPDLEEIILRKKLERELRYLWVDTMPNVLKSSKHLQESQNA